MDLRLLSLSIRNFKGIRELVIAFDGQDARISGDNATGKTSVVDAFMWLLFGKDHAGDKVFPIKPKDANGDEVHNLVIEVEGVFLRDGREMRLRRQQEEKWTRKRGREDQTYEGNTESFWVNDVETKLAAYRSAVADMVGSEEIFMLVTNPMAFNSMEWRKRREVLLKMSGVDVDGAIAQIPDFASVAEEIREKGLTPDRLLKVYKDRVRDGNDRLKEIPVRIDEIFRGMPEVSERTLSDARYNVQDCEQTLSSVEMALATCRVSGAQNQQAELVRKAKDELEAYEAKARLQHKVKVDAYNSELRSVNAELDMRKRMQAETENGLKAKEAELKLGDAKLNSLRLEYSRVYETKFDKSTVADVCPTCGQELPEDMYGEALEKARSAFESDKTAKLQEINKRGTAMKESVEEIRRAVARMANDQQLLEAQVKELEQHLSELGEAPAELSFDGDAQHQSLVAALEAVNVPAAKDDTEAKIEALLQRKREVNERMAANREIVAKAEAAQLSRNRIADLEREQKDKGAEIAAYERRIYQIEQYIMKRASLLEEQVNDQFPSVRWQLQRVNINGGVEDVCVCLVRNAESGALVEWEKANGAGKINAGLEIVNALCAYYGISAPVLIDNAESNRHIIPTVGQQITFVVTGDKSLVIETESKKEDVA